MLENEKCFSLKLPNRHITLTSLFISLSAIFIGIARYYDELNLNLMPKIFFVSGFVFLTIFFAIYMLMRAINSREGSPTTLFILSTMEIVLIASAITLAISLTIKHIEFAIFFVPLSAVIFTALPTLRKIKAGLVENTIRGLLALSSFIVTFAISDIILADEDKVAIVKLAQEAPQGLLYTKTPLASIFLGGSYTFIILLIVASLFLIFASEKRDYKGLSLFFLTAGTIFFILTTTLAIFLSYKFADFDIVLAVLLIGISLIVELIVE